MNIHIYQNCDFFGDLESQETQINVLPVANGFMTLLAPEYHSVWKQHFNVPDDKPFNMVQLQYECNYERDTNGLLKIKTIKHVFKLNAGWGDLEIGDLKAVADIDENSAKAFAMLLEVYNYARNGSSV